MKVTIKSNDNFASKNYENVARAYLTEYENFYVMIFKDKIQLCLASNTISWVQEIPEEGDDELF